MELSLSTETGIGRYSSFGYSSNFTGKELKKEIEKTSYFVKQVSKLNDNELEIINAIVTGMNIQKSLSNVDSV